MQIIGLHKNVYTLYAWARTQECLDAYRIKYEDPVRQWEALRAEGVSLAGSVAKFECVFALVQCCAILFIKDSKAGAIHDD